MKQGAGESPNDRNDRAIRVAAKWYADRFPSVKVLLLSNDVDNRRKATDLGLQTMSIQARTSWRLGWVRVQNKGSWVGVGDWGWG